MESQMRPTRRLTPTERVIGSLVCEGLSNSAIANRLSTSEKAIENALFRLVRSFGIKSDSETNCRVMFALAYRVHFGDEAIDKWGVPCRQQAVGPNGTLICVREPSQGLRL